MSITDDVIDNDWSSGPKYVKECETLKELGQTQLKMPKIAFEVVWWLGSFRQYTIF